MRPSLCHATHSCHPYVLQTLASLASVHMGMPSATDHCNALPWRLFPRGGLSLIARSSAGIPIEPFPPGNLCEAVQCSLRAPQVPAS